MTELDYQAVKEVIRLLPTYSKTLDFDIIVVAYQNALQRERINRDHQNHHVLPRGRRAH